MKTSRLAVLPCALLLAFGTACNGDPAPEPLAEGSPPAPAAATEPEPQAAPTSGAELFSRVAPGKAVAIPVVAGQEFSGEHLVERDGSVTAFGVRIGTYYGQADGSLTLTLCAEAVCREATTALSGAKDNDFLVFPLVEPLAVGNGTRLDYTLARSSDNPANRVAIWTYPKPSDQAGIVDPAGKTVAVVARTMVRVQ